MIVSVVGVSRIACHWVLADLPFFPRPPGYTLYIAQLILGAVCLGISLSKEPITDKSGQVYLNRGFIRVALLILGGLAVVFAAVGFVQDKLKV